MTGGVQTGGGCNKRTKTNCMGKLGHLGQHLCDPFVRHLLDYLTDWTTGKLLVDIWTTLSDIYYSNGAWAAFTGLSGLFLWKVRTQDRSRTVGSTFKTQLNFHFNATVGKDTNFNFELTDIFHGILQWTVCLVNFIKKKRLGYNVTPIPSICLSDTQPLLPPISYN